MAVQYSTFCKGCWQHMRMPISIRGPLSVPYRLAGVKVSRMNPNLCNICETMFTRVKRRKQVIVPATVLFADLRGYTAMAQETHSDELSEMLHAFMDQCAAAIWERDGIVNKFVGDAVLAIFNFPISREDHVQQAALAARDIQRRWSEISKLEMGGAGALGIGVGIHTGMASVGEIGTAYKDFTITGPVVNMASRIQGAAKAGEIVVSDDVYQFLGDAFQSSEVRECQFKGIDRSVTVHTLMSDA